MIISVLGPSETSLPSIPAKQKKLFFVGQPLGILIFRFLSRHWTGISGYITGNQHHTNSAHLRICKQDACNTNKSASLLTVTAEVARFEHSGTTHIIHRFYHVEDHVCISLPAFASQLTADDRHRMGAISRKALRRDVSHTDFDIDEIINCIDLKLFSKVTQSQPRHCVYIISSLPRLLHTALTVFGKATLLSVTSCWIFTV